MKRRPDPHWLDDVQRQHLEALAREQPWLTDRERLRALTPLPPKLAQLARRLPAPRRTP